MDRYVTTNGVRLRYLDHEGGDPPIVYLHGLGTTCHAADGLVGAGLSPRFRVIAPDLRGRGLSDKPDTGYEMRERAADVIGLMDALGLERAVLAGHSGGGHVAYYLGAEYPDRVERIVAVDIGAELDEEAVEQVRPAIEMFEATYDSLDAFISTFEEQPLFASEWDDQIEAHYTAGIEELPDGTARYLARPEHLYQILDENARVDWADVRGRIRQPVLLLRATQPFGPRVLLSEEEAQRTVDDIADCRMIEFEANHLTIAFGATAPRVVAGITEFVSD